MRWLVLLLCLAFSAQAAEGRLEKLGPELLRLAKKNGTVEPVTVRLLDPKTTFGWFTPMNVQEREITIIDHGDKENLKTLRHEMEHVRQHDAGEPFSEEKAKAAEKEDGK